MSSAHPVKEPSMDEILASIRRIIESGDDRPGLAALNVKSRDPNREKLRADDAGPPAREGEPRALSLLVTETPARTQEPAGAAEPAQAPGSGHAGLTPVEEAMPGDAASGAAGGEPVLPGSEDGPRAQFRRTPLPSAAEMLPAFWLKPDRRSPPVVAPQAPPGNSTASAGGTASRPAGDGSSGEKEDGRVAADLAPGNLPLAGADPMDAASDEDAPPDFALDFDEEDFAEELRNEARLAELKAAAGVDALHQKGTAAPVPAPAPVSFSAPTQAARDDAAPAPGSKSAETSALISEQAGEQVAAAFDDLARAIREGQMKSMEEMAREMLRPMLQEWLDDNLPRLVERLVRDEIERVARGGRR